MGLYNPHFPYIVGEEWVPIRNEDLQFSPSISAVEIGYQFNHGPTSDSIGSSRYYLNKFAEHVDSTVVPLFITQTFFAALYEARTEDETGPINVIRVPVMAGVGSGGAPPSLVNSTSFQQALAQPNDGMYVRLSALWPGPFFSILDLGFSVRQFDQLLYGKRIVAINVVYNAAVTSTSEPNTTYLDLAIGSVDYGRATFSELGTMHIGDTNWFFATTHAGLPSPTPHPWTPLEVRRFDFNDASSVRVRFQAASDEAVVENQVFELYYVAMDIYYCEEKRLAMGGGVHSLQGMNQTPLYAPPGDTSGITLSSNKQYTITLAAADTGDARGLTGTGSILAQPYPSLNAIRQLYETTYHPGVQINHPSPVGPNIVGKTFTKESINILPQLTLHKTGVSPDVIGDVHAYGRQVAAQVYGTIIAEQTIEDSNIGNVTTQQVRYYARRFGDTDAPLTLARSSAPTTAIATLTPAAWDELDPENGIIDGWKEVTLTLDVPQSFTGTRPGFQWSAANETAGNRWEILAMVAPSISGTPLNQYTPAPASYQLGTATYGWPVSGASDALRWLQVPPSQAVSAVPSSKDPTADAVLMFAVTPPAVTGIVLTEQTQALSGIAGDVCVDCDSCVPSGMKYHKIAWDMGMLDTFSRTVSGGWGTSDSGDVWSTSETNSGVSNGVGYVGFNAASTDVQVNTPDIGLSDYEVYWEFTPAAYVTNGIAYYTAMVRWSDTAAYYAVEPMLRPNGVIDIDIFRRDAGFTTLSTALSVGIYAPGDVIAAKARVVGNNILGKVWNKARIEPPWQVQATDTTYPNQRGFGVRPGVGPAFTPIPWTASFNLINVYPATVSDGGFYELQRMDSLTDWETIMRVGPDALIRSFNDYEARVGISSSYRMRIVGSLNFYGSWSSTVSHTLSSPGVTGGACVDGVGVLIFTTNVAQDGRYNLAYTQTWDQQVQEDFSFPEASTVSLNRVYQRDFAVAFKGTERGGEQFARNILVANAAVSPERLANISSLRDMAWADVPYICVRDEIGDRWFALVQVPAETVRRNRQLYVAALAITEVSDTPYAVLTSDLVDES